MTFDEAWQIAAPRIDAWCRSRRRDDDRFMTPDDLRQMVAMRAFAAWSRFDIDAPASDGAVVRRDDRIVAWFILIAKRILIDRHRYFTHFAWLDVMAGGRVRNRVESILIEGSATTDSEEMVLGRMMAEYLCSVARRAVKSEEWRTFVDFVAADGDFGEMARQTGTHYRAYQARIHRIRVKMRRALGAMP